MSKEDLKSPREVSPEMQAKNFCCYVREAAEKVRRADALRLEAEAAATRVVAQSMYRDLPFRLLVKIPPEVRSTITQDYRVVEEGPDTFEASEIKGINNRGVQFWDHLTDRYLNIFGHEFEVSPVFEDQPDQP